MAQLEGLVPPDLAKAIAYTQYQQGGVLTPEQLSALPIEAQEVIQLKESRQEGRAEQKAALDVLKQLSETGMGPQERAALEMARLKSAQDFQANIKSLQQSAAQRGMGGSQSDFAAQLAAAQQGSQNAAMENLQAAAMAAQNRQAALQNYMAGAQGLRQQDLSIDQSNVEARRQRQLFDIQNARARQASNAQMAQQANLYNLQRQQEAMDKNVGQANQEALRVGYLAPQLMYQNALGLARAKAGVYGERAGLAQQQSQAQAQGMANLFGGISSAFGGVAGSKNKQKELDLAGRIYGYKWDDDSGTWK